MRILKIYIPIFNARRKIRFFNSLSLWDKHTELIRFMNITLDERE